jgi:hypothetical protein
MVAEGAPISTRGKILEAIQTHHKSVMAEEAILSQSESLETGVLYRNWRRFRKEQFVQESVLESLAAAVIIANTAAIGLSCDMDPNSGYWNILDAIFLFLFSAERLIKLYFHGVNKYFCGNERGWNCFETMLVFVSIVELVAASLMDFIPMSVFRLIRLVRITKIIRVLRLPMFRELMMMINGAMGGIRTLFWSVLLISLPLYSVALVLRETVGRQGVTGGSESFKSLPLAFFTMFRCVVGGDCSNQEGEPIFVLLATQVSWMYGGIYCITMVLMTFGLFNVIVAIYVENTVQAAKHNELALKHQRLQDDKVFRDKIRELLDLLYMLKNKGKEGRMAIQDLMKMEISPDFFIEICSNQRFQDILHELDVAEEDQLDLFDTLDVDGGGTIDLEELILGIHKLRGDPRRADIISVALMVKCLQETLTGFEEDFSDAMDKQEAALIDIRKSSAKAVNALNRAAQRGYSGWGADFDGQGIIDLEAVEEEDIRLKKGDSNGKKEHKKKKERTIKETLQIQHLGSFSQC